MTRKEIIFNATNQRPVSAKNKKGFQVETITVRDVLYEININFPKVPNGIAYDKSGERVKTYTPNGKTLVSIVTPFVSANDSDSVFIINKEMETYKDAITFIANTLNTTCYSDTRAKYGIYGYRNPDGILVYIGKDSNILQEARHWEHLNKQKQEIDEYAINLDYVVLFKFYTKEEMDAMETLLIKQLDPLHNKMNGSKGVSSE